MVGAGQDVELLGGDARGLGRDHPAGGQIQQRARVRQVLGVEAVGEQALGVHVVELDLAEAGLAMRAEADVGLQGQDLAQGDRVDRGGVLRQVEQAALGPAVVEHALLELQVAHGARLAVPERAQGQGVALLAVEDPGLDVPHVGPRRGLGPLGLARGLVRGVQDGQADGRVGAGVLPALEHVQVQRAPRDPVQGRHGLLRARLAQALDDPGVGLAGGARRHGLEEHALGRRQAEHAVQAVQDVLGGRALLHEAEQALDDRLVPAPVRRRQELLDRVLAPLHRPGHGGLHGPQLELALAPRPVVGHAHARLPPLRL